MKSASSMYTKFITKFEQSRSCPLCVRSFASNLDENAFKGKLDNILARVPDTIASAEKNLNDWSIKLTSLRALQSVWDDCERLSKIEIPDARNKREQLEREKTEQYSVFEELDTEIVMVDAELSHSKQLKARSSEAILLTAEIQQIERDIANMMKDLGSSGSAKTVVDVQKEYESIQNQW